MDEKNATSTKAETNIVAASFITEVLASAGRLEKEDLNAKLGKLSQRIAEVKCEVDEAIENEYEHFLPYLHVAPELTERVDTLQKEVNEVTEKIETEMKAQLNTSSSEFQHLSDKLIELTYMSELLGQLTELHQLDLEASTALQANDFSTAGRRLETSKKHLSAIASHPELGYCDVRVLAALSSACEQQSDRLETKLYEVWSEHLKWDVRTGDKDDSGGGDSGASTTGDAILTVKSSSNARTTFANAAQTLHQMDILEPKLKQLGRRFLELLIVPVLQQQKTVVVTESSSQCAPTKELTVRKPKSKKGARTLEDTFDTLVSCLTFLNQHLLGVEISDEKEDSEAKDKEMDGTSNSKRPLMVDFGALIADEFVQLVIDACLAPAVPTAKKDLDGFTAVIKATSSLQELLKELRFLPAPPAPAAEALTSYVSGIDVLFSRKKSRGILSESRRLMCCDVHDTVKISSREPLGQPIELLPAPLRRLPSGGKEDKTAANLAIAADGGLSVNTFRLPPCRISLSTQQLVKMAYEVLFEATQCDGSSALQLFNTVRLMFELYITVVPTYHKESLATLPQLAALNHNNCMYVSHHLMTMKHQYDARVQAKLPSTASFVDLVPKLRRLGTECFLKMLTTQKMQLIEYLSSANGFVSISEDKNWNVCDRAIRQVFHQLGHLAKLWRGVLPEDVYTKSLGTLLQSAIDEVVGSIVALDDISADDATELAVLLGMVVDRSPPLFELGDDSPEEEEEEKDQEEPAGRQEQEDGRRESEQEERSRAGLAGLLRAVPHWRRLLELRIVLEADLQQIADRWAEAKGPLAVEFSANEVKKLVRALFQNTDRRAAVLATIRQPVKN